MFPASLIAAYAVIVLLVQNVDSIETSDITEVLDSRVEIPLNIAFLQSKHHNLRNFVSNKDDVYNQGLLMSDTYENGYKSDATYQEGKFPLPNFMQPNRVLKKRHIRASITSKKSRSKEAKRNDEIHSEWHKWTKWSSCSVTCGKGREIRWRHCRSNCNGIETEMEEKECQLPACPRKLFGIIKL